ncbi:MAG: class I SAM-dependent methyltransferase [Cyanothece sp. SIO1E1]|nr:class I SAM-dependent methyltransferase [Cyanothece sp. SIO1E1]
MTSKTLNRKARFFDRWAPTYDLLFTTVIYQAIHQRLLEYVQLSAQPYVLDLGCGTGRLLNRLAAEFPHLQGTGLDLSAEMLRQARLTHQHHPRLIFVQGNAAALPFEDGQFEAVFNTISFLHYPDPKSVLAEVSRVLAPGGRFYLVDLTTPKWRSQVLRVRNPMGGFQLYSPTARKTLAATTNLSWVEHQYLLGPVLLTIFAKA